MVLDEIDTCINRGAEEEVMDQKRPGDDGWWAEKVFRLTNRD